MHDISRFPVAVEVMPDKPQVKRPSAHPGLIPSIREPDLDRGLPKSTVGFISGRNGHDAQSSRNQLPYDLPERPDDPGKGH